MTNTMDGQYAACRVVCLGGKGRNDSVYMKDKLPSAFDLCFADKEPPGEGIPLAVPHLWRLRNADPDPIELGEFEAGLPTLLEGTDKLFIVLGFGGKTGTQLCLRLAKAAQQKAVPTFCFASLPFGFEGARISMTKKAMVELAPYINALFTFGNDELIKTLRSSIKLNKAFEAQHQWLLQAIFSVNEKLASGGVGVAGWPPHLNQIELGDGRPIEEYF